MNLQVLASKKKYSWLFICLGAVIYGASLGLIISPNQLAPGGIAGIAVMVTSFLPIKIGSVTMILNVPLLLIAIKVFGSRFLMKTVFAIILSGVTADILSSYEPLTMNTLLGAVFGGAVMGLGCGVVFLAGGTTGGTDIVAKLVRRKKPYISTGKIFLAIDGVICLASGFVFDSFDKALYAFITLIIFSKILDIVLYGGNSAKLVLIISHKSEIILPFLLSDIKIGCTILNGRSGYTGENTDTLLCAMKKQALPDVKKLVQDIDKKAFMLVGNTNEVYGEGFQPNESDFF